jgi:hypothetical protein
MNKNNIQSGNVCKHGKVEEIVDNLFSTDKDRKNAILSKYDKKSSDQCIFFRCYGKNVA